MACSRRPRPVRVLTTCALAVLLAVPSVAAEWTRFRGPNGQGRVPDTPSIPTEFGEDDWDWATDLPGVGHSQPVSHDGRLFITSAPQDGSERLVHALSLEDGSILWTYRFASGPYHNHRWSSYASSTPCVDDERVYVAFQHPGRAFLAALDHDGNLVWQHDLGPFASQHGFGASPMLFEDLVVFPVHQIRGDGPASPSFVVALERETGHLVWKTPRPSRRAAYGTPCVRQGRDGRPELVLTSGGVGVYALDARTGEPRWHADVFDLRTVSSPVLAAGLIIGTCGSGGGGNYLVAVRPDGSGDVTDTHVLYRLDQAIPYVPTGVARGDRLFLVSDKVGAVTCLDAARGEVIWRDRADGSHAASPVLIGDRLFCVSQKGEVIVLGTGDTFEVLGRSSLGARTRTAPAVVDGRLLLRTYSRLVSVGGERGEASAAGSQAGR